jgi:regulator of RNase E activity RraA
MDWRMARDVQNVSDLSVPVHFSRVSRNIAPTVHISLIWWMARDVQNVSDLSIPVYFSRVSRNIAPTVYISLS